MKDSRFRRNPGIGWTLYNPVPCLIGEGIASITRQAKILLTTLGEKRPFTGTRGPLISRPAEPSQSAEPSESAESAEPSESAESTAE